MNIFIILSSLVFTSILIAVNAQAVSAQSQSNSLICSQEFFEKVEDSYKRKRFNSEMLGQVERQLNKIVLNCADVSWHYQSNEYLKVVQEESAENNFVVARYYWNKFQNGKTKSLGGILSRLKKIIEKYPNYSKIDEVEQLLSEANKENPNNGKHNNSMDVRAKQRLCYLACPSNSELRVAGFAPRHLNRSVASLYVGTFLTKRCLNS